ncbi:response regulator transcription factor [Demequina sp. NBRC 110055]|uniref:response regulator transcription factor n=1 Tax=Demequina sp. NBRC 110055 TaxID=1570344 RepID=UPI000A046775|nr:response regulator [Demequina sp. NBRC 110055]
MARVVVIEDDPDISLLVAHKLRAGGHEVEVESDGRAGLAAVVASTPDLVILDWMMPRMNGIEVCEAMRADLALATIPVLMLTAKALEVDLERAYAVGVDEYIQKPFSTRELMVRVARLLHA